MYFNMTKYRKFINVILLCIFFMGVCVCNAPLKKEACLKSFSFRTVRQPVLSQAEFVSKTVEHLEQFTENAEDFTASLRNIILNNPTDDNFNFFGNMNIDEESRINIAANAIVVLTQKAKDNPDIFHVLYYALMYMYLDHSTSQITARVFDKAKEISITDNLSPDFFCAYIDQIIKKSKNVSIMKEDIGYDVTLGKIKMTPKKTFISIMDIDNLSLFNKIYGKSVLDYIIEDIRRTAVITLFENGSFCYTNFGRDELFITVVNVKNTEKAGEILTKVNTRIGNKKYVAVELSDETNKSLSLMSQQEFNLFKEILDKKNIGISDGEYIEGKYLIIIPVSSNVDFLSREDADNFANNLLENINNTFQDNDLELNLEGSSFWINNGILFPVTVSIGFQTTDNDIEAGPSGNFGIAFEKANLALHRAKASGKNRVMVYNPNNNNIRLNNESVNLFRKSFIEDIEKAAYSSTVQFEKRDSLYGGIYDHEIFREEINKQIESGNYGKLLWIEPVYYDKSDFKKERMPFKRLNEIYGYEKADWVIRALSYILENSIPIKLRKFATLSRMSPDGLLIYFQSSDKEEIDNNFNIMTLSDILDCLSSKFNEYALGLNVSFEAAVGSTDNIENLSDLFFRLNYTHESKLNTEQIVTSQNNILKIFGPEVLDDVVNIQSKQQFEALKSLGQILP